MKEIICLKTEAGRHKISLTRLESEIGVSESSLVKAHRRGVNTLTSTIYLNLLTRGRCMVVNGSIGWLSEQEHKKKIDIFPFEFTKDHLDDFHAFLGSTIRNARKIAGLTQADLAKKIKKDRKVVLSWEKGKSAPRLGELVKITKMTNFGIVFQGIVGDAPRFFSVPFDEGE